MKSQKKSSESENWQFMVDAAKRGIEQQGYQLERLPGRGLSNVWRIKKNGSVQSASIRTSRNRWIAFPPLEAGKKWKTLDDVDIVVVSTVDSKDDPKNIEIYIFPAKEVRQRFNGAYGARKKAGQVIRDDFGMWVGLDVDSRGVPASVGSGIVAQYPPVAVYPIKSLLAANVPEVRIEMESKAIDQAPASRASDTIAEVMAWTRKKVSEIAGVRIEAVKLDLKIEY